jgi:hypothetical protein
MPLIPCIHKQQLARGAGFLVFCKGRRHAHPGEPWVWAKEGGMPQNEIDEILGDLELEVEGTDLNSLQLSIERSINYVIDKIERRLCEIESLLQKAPKIKQIEEITKEMTLLIKEGENSPQRTSDLEKKARELVHLFQEGYD